MKVEEFEHKWKDLLASKSHGDLPLDVKSLLSRIRTLEEGIKEIYELVSDRKNAVLYGPAWTASKIHIITKKLLEE